MEFKNSLKHTSFIKNSLFCFILAGCTGFFVVGCERSKPADKIAPAPRQVSALGRLEPENKVRKISVPSSLSGDRIEKLFVEEGRLANAQQEEAFLNKMKSSDH
jgi:multidrug efflux pump subunit AcrA (membrane-fusion protein)